ncbi:hypothetical protein TrVFT333_008905 [Trichoderma virens FT-333]|nr:hypothetical protein TrVFT333_008905 [Trichoderma virens FT-333]
MFESGRLCRLGLAMAVLALCALPVRHSAAARNLRLNKATRRCPRTVRAVEPPREAQPSLSLSLFQIDDCKCLDPNRSTKDPPRNAVPQQSPQGEAVSTRHIASGPYCTVQYECSYESDKVLLPTHCTCTSTRMSFASSGT